MTLTRVPTATLAIVIMFTCHQASNAYEIDTHRLINESAARSSSLHSFLSVELATPSFIVCEPENPNCLTELFFKEFPGGINEPVNGLPGMEWIILGGAAEDQFLGNEWLGGAFRSTRHFHTPLRAWNQAGVDFLGINFQSSIIWGQNPGQSPGEKASWKDARDAYYTALTARTPTERNDAWARTFQILGQLMHLVEDAASPAHTRNDPHPPWNSDGFEKFMGNTANQHLINGFTSADPSILQVSTGDPIATVPIAHLLDTDTYDGTNPAATLGAIGLAEFTSANFFSDDTTTATSLLPYPDAGRLQPGPIINNRQYFSKIGDGVSVTHMARESLWHRFLPSIFSRYTLDSVVYTEYASHLLSRAIGYSATLIDYFFRGRMELEGPHNAHVCCSNIRNSSSPGEESGAGTLTIVLPMTDQTYEIRGPFPFDLSRTFQPIFGQIPTDPNPFYFPDFPDLEGRFCAVIGTTVPCDVHIVYRGPLGQESDAVMVLRSPMDYD